MVEVGDLITQHSPHLVPCCANGTPLLQTATTPAIKYRYAKCVLCPTKGTMAVSDIVHHTASAAHRKRAAKNNPQPGPPAITTVRTSASDPHHTETVLPVQTSNNVMLSQLPRYIIPIPRPSQNTVVFRCVACGSKQQNVNLRGETAIKVHVSSAEHQQALERKLSAWKNRGTSLVSSRRPAPSNHSAATTPVVVIHRPSVPTPATSRIQPPPRNNTIPLNSAPLPSRRRETTIYERRAAAIEAIRRFGPVIRPFLGSDEYVMCEICGVDVHEQSVGIDHPNGVPVVAGVMLGFAAADHVHSTTHLINLRVRREKYATDNLHSRGRSERKTHKYRSESDRKIHSRGGIAPSSGTRGYSEQVVVRTPKPEFPSHYAALFANPFPDHRDLVTARNVLSTFAKHELSTIADWWDPCAPDGRLSEQGKALSEIGSFIRVLNERCTLLQETCAAIELSGYNQRDNEERRVEPKRMASGIQYYIELPGVSENRPSVIRGDVFYVFVDPISSDNQSRTSGYRMASRAASYLNSFFTQRSSTTVQTYKAYVHHVNEDNIVFSMPDDFKVDMKRYTYSIVFELSRAQEFNLLFAIHSVPLGAMLLQSTCTKACDNSTNSMPYAPLLPVGGGLGALAARRDLNEEQNAFIDHVHGSQRLSVLWGPPGTGKTKTVVAAAIDTVLRALQCGKGKRVRILMCAPSNEAADLMAERIVDHPAVQMLIESQPNHFLLRLPSLSRDPKSLPERLRPFSPVPLGSGFLFPMKEDIEDTLIVVTTLMTASRLRYIGIAQDHFTHLFVDEAGHSTEQLLTIALNVTGGGLPIDDGNENDNEPIFNCTTKVVLAGDHKQLGPYVTVPALIETNLNYSPLLRIYNDPSFWNHVGHQLLICYRSHPAIVHVVNACYEDRLRAFKPSVNTFAHLWSTDLIHKFWREHCIRAGHDDGFIPKLTAPSAPILSINHSFPESRERDSPSWMNDKEVECVVNLVFTLWDNKLIGSFDEVAIISPYRKQVEKISKRFWGMMQNQRADLARFMIWVDPATGQGLIKPRIPMKVATVDSFQGREARVVIVSCVRSDKAAQSTDSKFGLGFLSQPERANVALSRAQDLLIIIGNRRLLQKDPRWDDYYKRMDSFGEGVVMNIGGNDDLATTEEDSDDDENTPNPAADETDRYDGATRVAAEMGGTMAARYAE